jgi:serine/threonine protein kinase
VNFASLDRAGDAGDKAPVDTAPNPGDGATRGEASGLPKTFGRYVLFDLIGRGGMAEIYLARAKTTEAGGSRLVVVKQILPELSRDAKFADALVQEAKLAARLSHANVAQVFDLGREGDEQRLFITMEYVEGLDLNELLRRCARAKVPLPIEFALLVVMEVLRGLDYAHRRMDDAGKPLGIVHRDVSPSNVLVSVDGEVKLCDFGIARANDSADSVSADAIQGKAGYMSPEHARGEALDGRADVFAAGVILWELLSGRRMYKADKEKGESLLSVARRAQIPEVPSRELPFEEDLQAIVKKALAVDRAQRYASAAAMLDDLQRYVARARLVASPIRLGDWLTEHFGNELVTLRRARERAAKAIEAGPVATITPIAPPAEPMSPVRPVSLWPPAAAPADPPKDEQLAPKKAQIPLAALITTIVLVVGLLYYFTR